MMQDANQHAPIKINPVSEEDRKASMVMRLSTMAERQIRSIPPTIRPVRIRNVSGERSEEHQKIAAGQNETMSRVGKRGWPSH